MLLGELLTNVKAALGSLVVSAAVVLADADTIPIQGTEGVWLWRGFVSLLILIAALYLRNVYREIQSATQLTPIVEEHHRYMRAIVRIMAAEAEEHGNKRATDTLVHALLKEMDDDQRRRAGK